jgi:hypothetical protein
MEMAGYEQNHLEDADAYDIAQNQARGRIGYRADERRRRVAVYVGARPALENEPHRGRGLRHGAAGGLAPDSV